MNPSHKMNRNRGAFLAVLLVVMATASGCGKAMPTSPLVDPAGQASPNPSVGSTSMMDGGGGGTLLGGGDPAVSPDPAPEVQPTPIGIGTPGPGHGHGKGHPKKH